MEERITKIRALIDFLLFIIAAPIKLTISGRISTQLTAPIAVKFIYYLYSGEMITVRCPGP